MHLDCHRAAVSSVSVVQSSWKRVYISEEEERQNDRSRLSRIHIGCYITPLRICLVNSLQSLARVRPNRIIDYDFDSVLKNRQFGLTALASIRPFCRICNYYYYLASIRLAGLLSSGFFDAKLLLNIFKPGKKGFSNPYTLHLSNISARHKAGANSDLDD